MLLTQHWFWYLEQQMKGINGTLKISRPPKTGRSVGDFLGGNLKRRI